MEYGQRCEQGGPTDATPGDWTKWGDDQPFLEAEYNNSYDTPTKIDMNLITRHVLFNDIVNNGPTEWGNGYGLSEVEFLVAIIPEPSTATLLFLSALLLLMRPRRYGRGTR